MKKLCIIASLILTIPHVLFPAANQVTEQIPQAPGLPPAPAQPVYVLGNNDLTNEDYEYCMELTKEINPKMFAYLERAEKIWGQRCFKKGTYSFKDADYVGFQIKNPTYRSKGHPYFILPTDFKNKPLLFKFYLAQVLNKLQFHQPKAQGKVTFTLSQEQRNTILELVQTLAPELHQKMIAADPTGQDHIAPSTCLAAIGTHTDGLPHIVISEHFFKLPEDQQLSALGHELGHYIDTTHMFQFIRRNNDYDFNLLNSACNQQKEYEADRTSILLFKASNDAFIALMKSECAYEGKQMGKSHPTAKNRITHLKSLETDPSYNAPKKTIAWDDIIDEYKKFLDPYGMFACAPRKIQQPDPNSFKYKLQDAVGDYLPTTLTTLAGIALFNKLAGRTLKEALNFKSAGLVGIALATKWVREKIKYSHYYATTIQDAVILKATQSVKEYVRDCYHSSPLRDDRSLSLFVKARVALKIIQTKPTPTEQKEALGFLSKLRITNNEKHLTAEQLKTYQQDIYRYLFDLFTETHAVEFEPNYELHMYLRNGQIEWYCITTETYRKIYVLLKVAQGYKPTMQETL